MNQTIGKTGASITGLAVLPFAVSMVVRLFDDSIGTFPSCLSFLFIAIGFVVFICSILAVNNESENKAVGIADISFAGIHAVIIFPVYFAEITNRLSQAAHYAAARRTENKPQVNVPAVQNCRIKPAKTKQKETV